MIRLLLLLVALGAGVTAIMMFFSRPVIVTSPGVVEDAGLLTETSAPVRPEPSPQRNILVTSSAIEQGGTIDESGLEWMPVDESLVSPSYIFQDEQPEAREQASQLVPMVSLDAREPLRWDRLQPPRPASLSARLSPGKRAVAVAVSAESTAGGFVLPEDHVDVLLVGSVGGRSGTEVLVSNVRVIALDQTTVEDLDGETILSSTATLELDPAQMAAVIAARDTNGQLVLALRSIADAEEPQESYTPPERNIIRVIRNGRVEEIEVNN